MNPEPGGRILGPALHELGEMVHFKFADHQWRGHHRAVEGGQKFNDAEFAQLAKGTGIADDQHGLFGAQGEAQVFTEQIEIASNVG